MIPLTTSGGMRTISLVPPNVVDIIGMRWFIPADAH